MTAMEQITDSPLAMFLVLWAAGHLILVQQLHQTNLKTTEQVFMRFFENRNTHSSNNIRALGNGRDDGSVEGRDAAAAASSGSRGDNGRLLPEETGVQPQADPINNSAARHAPVATLVNDDSSRSHNDKLPQIMGKLEMNTDRAHSLRDEFKRLEKEIHGLSEQCERCTLPEEIDTVIKIYDGKISALVEEERELQTEHRTCEYYVVRCTMDIRAPADGVAWITKVMDANQKLNIDCLRLLDEHLASISTMSTWADKSALLKDARARLIAGGA